MRGWTLGSRAKGRVPRMTVGGRGPSTIQPRPLDRTAMAQARPWSFGLPVRRPIRGNEVPRPLRLRSEWPDPCASHPQLPARAVWTPARARPARQNGPGGGADAAHERAGAEREQLAPVRPRARAFDCPASMSPLHWLHLGESRRTGASHEAGGPGLSPGRGHHALGRTPQKHRLTCRHRPVIRPESTAAFPRESQWSLPTT